MFVPEGVPGIHLQHQAESRVFRSPRSVPLSVQVIVPVPPTAGTVPQVHPAGGVIDWKVRVRRRVFRKRHPGCRHRRTVIRDALRVSNVASRRHRSGGRRIGHDQIRLRREGHHVGRSRVLFVEFGSVVDELSVAVSFIAVPAAVPAFTVSTTGKLAVAPGAKLGSVQMMVPAAPTAGVEHVHPAGTGVARRMSYWAAWFR